MRLGRDSIRTGRPPSGRPRWCGLVSSLTGRLMASVLLARLGQLSSFGSPCLHISHGLQFSEMPRFLLSRSDSLLDLHSMVVRGYPLSSLLSPALPPGLPAFSDALSSLSPPHCPLPGQAPFSSSAHPSSLPLYLRHVVRSDWPPVSFSCRWHTVTLPTLRFLHLACHPPPFSTTVLLCPVALLTAQLCPAMGTLQPASMDLIHSTTGPQASWLGLASGGSRWICTRWLKQGWALYVLSFCELPSHTPHAAFDFIFFFPHLVFLTVPSLS